MRLNKYINEEKDTFVIQEYLFGWYQNDKTTFKTLKDAKKHAEQKTSKITKSNKKAAKDLRPKAFGKVDIYPQRIVNLKTNEKYPATKEDEKKFKQNKVMYNET
jgi:hypothetical protein